MPKRRKSPLEIEVTEPHQCSVDLRLKILGKVPFFGDLSPADLDKINTLFRERGFEQDEVICFAGDPAEQLFVVADGRVKLVRHTLAGKDVVLDILKAGEFFGSLTALGDDVYSETAQAQTSTCILTIGKDSFCQILDLYPPVTLKVINIMAARLRTAQEYVRQLSASPVEARIAHTLLVLCKKFGQATDVGLLIQVPLSRDDLAAMTGTTTETASRVMSQFQKDGLIETGRQWVAILDRAGLEAISEES